MFMRCRPRRERSLMPPRGRLRGQAGTTSAVGIRVAYGHERLARAAPYFAGRVTARCWREPDLEEFLAWRNATLE